MTKAYDSLFNEKGYKNVLSHLYEEIRKLYCADDIPWVIGFSGGKDSTTVLQLIWLSLKELAKEKLTKCVYVLSTDTLVENPEVSRWVATSINAINNAALKQELPITAHILKPKLTYRFWVNLLGKGYPSPRPMFRWCTERLKIDPSSTFIREVVQQNGEAIVVLGSRKAESTARAGVMEKFEVKRIRDKLSPNGSLPNSFVYTPIEDWTHQDVWSFLLNQEIKNPWGQDNRHLWDMYVEASDQANPDGGECPFFVETQSSNCGSSRFGCWVCTMVTKDKSMSAMVQNDIEKRWMKPLLEFRDELADHKNDRERRDFRRMAGNVQLFHDRPIPGPYKQEVREKWLGNLLEIQEKAKKERLQFPEVAQTEFELISMEELKEIRRIWLMEKHELEDNLPRIYKQATGQDYPDKKTYKDNALFDQEAWGLLKKICGDDELHYQLTRELISVEQNCKTMIRRSGLFGRLENALRKGFYDDEADAVERARNKEKTRESERTKGSSIQYADEFIRPVVTI